jgi:hypothetical protein
LDFEGAAESSRRFVAINKQIKFTDVIKGIKDLGATFLSLGRVLLTNPLFLLASVIPIIITNFEKLTKAGGFIGDFFSGIKVFIDDLIQGFTKLTDAIGLTDFASQKAAENAEKAAEKIGEAIGKIQDDIEKRQDESIKKAGGYSEEAIKIEREKVEAIIAYDNEQIASYEAVIASGKKLTESQSKSYEFFKTEREKELENFKSFETNIRKEVSETQKERAEKWKAANAEIKKNQEDLIIFLKGENSIEAQTIKINRFYDDLISKKGTTDAQIIELEKRKNAELAVLDAQEKTRQENVAEEIKPIIRDVANVRLESNVNTDNAIKQSSIDLSTFKKEKSDEEIAQDEQVAFGKVDQAARAFDALGGLLSAFSSGNEKNARKAFQINKAFALGTAIANTGLAVTAALTAGGNPIKLATSAQFVDAGIAATIGAANIVRIAQSKFQGGSSGGGGGSSSSGGGARPVVSGFGSSSTPATTAFNLFGQNNNLNTGGAPQPIEAGQGGAQPLAITVQVSETDITSTQNFVRRVNESATL